MSLGKKFNKADDTGRPGQTERETSNLNFPFTNPSYIALNVLVSRKRTGGKAWPDSKTVKARATLGC
jgi:hypothetical protein